MSESSDAAGANALRDAAPGAPRDAWQAMTWERQRLLPSVCPACGRQGVHGVDLPWVRFSESPGQEPPLERQLHYCDLCFERRERDRTQEWAWLVALAVLALCSGIAVTLMGGRWSRHAEWLSLACAWGALLTALARFRRPQLLTGERTLLCQDERAAPSGDPKRHPQAPSSDGHSEGPETKKECEGAASSSRPARVLVVTDSPHLQGRLLAEGGQARPLPRELVELEPSPFLLRLVSLQRWLPLPLAVLSWGALLALGSAEMRVINGGQESLDLLIDGRLASQVSPTRFETPHFGARLSLPAGWHEVALISSDGAVIAQERVRVWPGSQWIAGRLPQGQCLFVDEFESGSSGVRHALAFEAPLLEVPRPIDAWFQPLVAPPSEPSLLDEAARWSAAPGARRSLRLLPCAP